MIAAGRPWAKSGTAGHLEFAGGVAFRHELASLLLIDGPLRPLLEASPMPTSPGTWYSRTTAWLRVHVRDPSNTSDPSNTGAPSHPGDSSQPGPADPDGPPSVPLSGDGWTILGLAHGAVAAIPPMLGHRPARSPTTSASSARAAPPPVTGPPRQAPSPACSTATARSPWPTWRRSSAWRTGGRAVAGNWRNRWHHALVLAKSPTSAEAPPVIRSSSSNEVGNTACGCPAAAHTTSYFASQASTSVRIGAG